jgi:ribonucleotide monophosphatase NagD (HAD superfamily)
MRKIPGILLDIDGVIVHDGKPIPGALDAIKFLKTSLASVNPKEFSNENDHIPFSFVTNSGGKLEEEKANSINQSFNITNTKYQIVKSDVIMNFTPLRPIFQDYQDKIVLALGFGNIKSILIDCGVKRYITTEEYAILFPNAVPFSIKSKDNDKTDQINPKRTALKAKL